MEWSTINKEEGRKSRRPIVQIPKFSPSSIGYKFELVNLNHPNSMIGKRNVLPCCLFLFSILVTKSLVKENINEKEFICKNMCPFFSCIFLVCIFFFIP